MAIEALESIPPDVWQPKLKPATPVDELTGVPLLIYPYDDVDELHYLRKNQLALRNRGEDYADINHAFHPKAATELISSEGRSVRGCRGQLVRRSDHDDYHNEYHGPNLPTTADTRFKTVVFCAAGYIPREALDVRRISGREEVSLSDQQIYRLKSSGEVHIIQQEHIRKFLEYYILEKPELSHIDIGLIDEFLTINADTAYNERRKRFLTHQLLSMMIDPATEPLYDTYKQVIHDKLWDNDINTSPRRVVHDELIGMGQNKRRKSTARIAKILTEKLSIYRDMAEASSVA